MTKEAIERGDMVFTAENLSDAANAFISLLTPAGLEEDDPVIARALGWVDALERIEELYTSATEDGPCHYEGPSGNLEDRIIHLPEEWSREVLAMRPETTVAFAAQLKLLRWGIARNLGRRVAGKDESDRPQWSYDDPVHEFWDSTLARMIGALERLGGGS